METGKEATKTNLVLLQEFKLGLNWWEAMMRNNRFRDDLRDKYLFPQLKLPSTVI